MPIEQYSFVEECYNPSPGTIYSWPINMRISCSTGENHGYQELCCSAHNGGGDLLRRGACESSCIPVSRRATMTAQKRLKHVTECLQHPVNYYTTTLEPGQSDRRRSRLAGPLSLCRRGAAGARARPARAAWMKYRIRLKKDVYIARNWKFPLVNE